MFNQCQCFDTNGDEYAGSDGYGGSGERGDCGHALTSPITTCPGDPPCSDRGVCDPTHCVVRARRASLAVTVRSGLVLRVWHGLDTLVQMMLLTM